MPRPNWKIFTALPHDSKAQDHCGREDRKGVRIRGSGWQGNIISEHSRKAVNMN